MKKRMLKVVLSAALALSAAAAIPQSLTANAWARNGSEFVNTAGAYKVRQYFYYAGTSYNQGDILTVCACGNDSKGGHNLKSGGYLTDYYFYKLY